jgi:hypothetical protein
MPFDKAVEIIEGIPKNRDQFLLGSVLVMLIKVLFYAFKLLLRRRLPGPALDMDVIFRGKPEEKPHIPMTRCRVSRLVPPEFHIAMFMPRCKTAIFELGAPGL